MNSWERVKDPDDPRRCQHIIPRSGQCRNVAIEGCQYCSPHGGHVQERKIKALEMKNYRLSKFKARAEELSGSTQLSSLKDEVAILRILIEERINRCEGSVDLLLQSGPLSDLIMKCGALVEKCTKLEDKLGNLLDREKVTILAQTIVEVVSNYVSDDQLDEIAESISKTLDSL